MNNRTGAHLVIPCFNEEARLPVSAFTEFLSTVDVTVVFVNDGSSDGTARTIAKIESQSPGQVSVLSLTVNRGKAEAVRAGLRHAIDLGADLVGYADADLATPLEEVARVRATLAESPASIAMGCRVALLGARIERTPFRHYCGRVFATGASLVLRLPVYDTQCGAKWLRVSGELRAALIDPFISRWAFDVELLGRLLAGAPGVEPLPPTAIVEVPLRRWSHVAGSKLRFGAMVRACADLARIGHDLRRRRARASGCVTAWVSAR